MSDIDTSKLSNSAIDVLNTLVDRGPTDIGHATDMLWVLASELSENAKLIRSLEDLANRKQLTGLLNDRGFAEEISKEQNRVDRGQSVGGVIISIDLAGFKRINDTYNEQIGDLALQKFAELLKQFGFRDIDIIGNPGGDEFIVILTNTEFSYPKAGDEVSTHFENAGGIWGKIDALNKATQKIPFQFEYMDPKTKEVKTIDETITARMTISEYDSKTTIKNALADANEKAKLIKKFTTQYVLGGR